MKKFAVLGVFLTGMASAAPLLAPGTVDWKAVDLSACGSYPSKGKTIKVSQIALSPDPVYVALDPNLYPYRKMGDQPKVWDPHQGQVDAGLAPDVNGRVKKVSANCWPVEMWRNAFEVFNLRCTRCHGDAVGYPASGGLDMRTRSSILKGGKSGTAMVPGSTSGSLLYQRIYPLTSAERAASPRDLPIQEPPNGPLFGPEVEAIRIWIANGAPEP